MITKGQQAPYLYDVKNPPYRIIKNRLPLLFTLHFRRCLSSNCTFGNLMVPLVRTSICVAGYGHVALVFHLHQTIRSIVLILFADS